MPTPKERRSTRRGEPSENGDRPSTNPEFDEFKRFAKRLLRVPKKDLKEQEAKEKKRAG